MSDGKGDGSLVPRPSEGGRGWKEGLGWDEAIDSDSHADCMH